MKKILVILGLFLLVNSCTFHSHHRPGSVYEYKTTDTDGDDMFWYVIMMSDGNSYYTQSDSRVSNFNGVSWTQGTPKEVEILEPETELTPEPSEFPTEMQAEVDTSIDAAESADAADASSDAGGDSGGGDGGGDGGGGGD